MKTVFHVVRLNGLSRPTDILGVYSTEEEAMAAIHRILAFGAAGRVFIQQAWEV